MGEVVFLSAGVPDPVRSPKYAATADIVAISAAVSAFVYVTLGRRRLVWGGHPAITPMIWVAAQDLGIDYGSWVRLYQSNYFQDQFPEDNAQFKNVTYTQSVEQDRDRSLAAMRERMFQEHTFEAAVFIGGMDGILQEFDMFRKLQPNARVVPVLSTGGATLDIDDQVTRKEADLKDQRDYVALFHKHLGISVREERFKTPEAQPRQVEDRFWKPPPKP